MMGLFYFKRSDILGIPSENIFKRKKSSVKSKILLFIILLLLLFLFVSFIIYGFLDYSATIKIPIENFEINEYIGALNSVTEFNFSLDLWNCIFDILHYQSKIWFIYPVFLGLFIVFSTGKRNDFKNVEHGSARWMNDEEIKQLNKEAEKTEKKIPLGKDTYLSLTSEKVANLNEIVIGGSGAGKSFRKIKPDILQMTGSYVITDPKGELYRDTAKVLRNHGYKVRVLNLVNLNYSNSYNPFAYITSEQDVVDLASLFMKNTAGEGEKEDFFSGAALKLLTALMMYLYKSENEIKTFGRVIRLLNSTRYKNGSIDNSCELARCLNEHASKYPYDIASTNWGGMQGNAQETQSSINEVLSTRLSLFATTDLDAITSTDEMDFDMIGQEKTAVFLIIPSARNTYKAVCNIFYSQLFERLRRIADLKFNGCLPLLVSCELDEFANIGEIPAFNETLAVVRSYNIRICIVLQGLSQLKAIYEKTYESIIGNCDIFTLLGSKDNDTLQYVSDKLDKITVQNDSRTFNRGSGTTSGGGGQDTEATGERPLLYPNEIKRAIKPKGKSKKYGGNSIIFLGYEEPLFVMKYDTINHPLFAECGSKYPKYVHNNTYIDKEYAPIWEKRFKEYNKLYADFTEREQKSKEEFAREQFEEEVKEQQKLAEMFASAITPPPLNDEVTEADYQKHTEEMDREDYPPTQEFSDDDNFEDFPDFDEVNENLEDFF